MHVGVFCTLGLHRDEAPAQERLIERDLRDMAEVSMLRHAETGLWWAVKTSGRSRTAVYFVPACTCVLCGYMGVWIRAPGVITFARTFYLYACPVASRCKHGAEEIALTSDSNQAEILARGKTHARHVGAVAAVPSSSKTKVLKSTENRRHLQCRLLPVSMTFTASQQAANKNSSAAIDGRVGFRKMAREMHEQMSLTPAFDC